MATGTRGGRKQRALRETPPGGPVARMTRPRPASPAGTTGRARGLVTRRIRRRRRAGGLRGAFQAPLQGIELVRELVDPLVPARPIRLPDRRSQRPCPWKKGPRPKTCVGVVWLCGCQHLPGAARRGDAEVLLGHLTSEVDAIMTSHMVERPLWSRTPRGATASPTIGGLGAPHPPVSGTSPPPPPSPGAF